MEEKEEPKRNVCVFFFILARRTHTFTPAKGKRKKAKKNNIGIHPPLAYSPPSID